MFRFLLLAVVPLVAWPQQKAPPEQAARGMALFEDPLKGCSSCHALGGKGTPVGPDLKRLAKLSPRAIAIAVNASRTQYVQEVDVKGAGKFPGMEAGKDGTSIKVYDLSKTPPELKTLAAADVSMKDNQSWKHPAESLKLTPEQMADVVAYVRWASYGDTRGVTPEEVK